jgi:phosphoribosylformylglycinamidine synthase subunit PurSL
MVPDVHKTVTMDLKQAGDFLFIVGETGAELGGSHYGLIGGEIQSQHAKVPAPKAGALDATANSIRPSRRDWCKPATTAPKAVWRRASRRCVWQVDWASKCSSCHAPRDPYWAYSSDDVILFSETISRFVVEVRPEDSDKFRAALAGVPHECVGVIGGEVLRINGRFGEPLLDRYPDRTGTGLAGHLSVSVSR